MVWINPNKEKNQFSVSNTLLEDLCYISNIFDIDWIRWLHVGKHMLSLTLSVIRSIWFM